MRRRIPSALLLTALAATSVAAVAPDNSTDSVRAELPRGPEPAHVIDALAPEDREEPTLDEVIAARRVAYAMTPGVTPLFDDEPGGETPEPMPEPMPVAPAPSVGWVRAAPDLDGDGRDDLLTWSSEADDRTVHARRGIDGTELWSFEQEDDAWGFDPYAVPDVTGDGIADLLLTWSEDVEWQRSMSGGTGPESSSRYEFVHTWRNVTRLVSGRDGQVLYHHEVDARRHDVDEETSTEAATPLESDEESWRRETSYENALSWLLPSADHDGDGRADLVEVVVSADFVIERRTTDGLVEGSETFSTRSSGSADARVTSATGETIWSPDAGTVGRRGWLLPAGDLDGDAVTDLLWTADGSTDYSSRCDRTLVLTDCSERDDSDPHETYVTAYDGADLSVLWETDSGRTPELDEGAGALVPLMADVDGDGADDLRFRTGMVSGSDGSLLWDRPELWYGMTPLGVDGDGEVVLLAVQQGYLSCDEDPMAYVDHVEMMRIEGRDGTVRSQTALTAGSCEQDGSISTEVTGDLDGDGLRDLILHTWLYTSSGNSYDSDYEAYLETAAGERSSGMGVDRYVDGVDDLDGDGADDLLVFTYGYAQGTDDVGTVALADLGTRELWTLHDGDGEYAYAYILGDVDGDGGADVVLHEGSYDRHGGLDWVRIARGADLATLWTSAVERRGPVSPHAA